jgi:hypothetical protein
MAWCNAPFGGVSGAHGVVDFDFLSRVLKADGEPIHHGAHEGGDVVGRLDGFGQRATEGLGKGARLGLRGRNVLQNELEGSVGSDHAFHGGALGASAADGDHVTFHPVLREPGLATEHGVETFERGRIVAVEERWRKVDAVSAAKASVQASSRVEPEAIAPRAEGFGHRGDEPDDDDAVPVAEPVTGGRSGLAEGAFVAEVLGDAVEGMPGGQEAIWVEGGARTVGHELDETLLGTETAGEANEVDEVVAVDVLEQDGIELEVVEAGVAGGGETIEDAFEGGCAGQSVEAVGMGGVEADVDSVEACLEG